VWPREDTKQGENTTTKPHVKLLQIRSIMLKSNVMMMIIIIIIIIIMCYGIKGYKQRSYGK
jgi:t-SNARE complex subunit (syntaxin)